MIKYALLVFIFFFTIQGFAQNKIDFGIKAGVNYSDIGGGDYDFSKYKLGFHFGITSSYAISEKFSVAPELLFSRQGFRINGIEVRETFDNPSVVFDIITHLDYLNIPILATYSVLPALSFQLGPQIGINVGTKSVLKYENEGVQLEDEAAFLFTPDTNTLDVGIAGGIQVNLGSKMFIQGRYTIGVTSIHPNGKLKNRNAQLSLGYKL